MEVPPNVAGLWIGKWPSRVAVVSLGRLASYSQISAEFAIDGSEVIMRSPTDMRQLEHGRQVQIQTYQNCQSPFVVVCSSAVPFVTNLGSCGL